MPAATTHVEFAKDVLVKLTSHDKHRITNMPMFYLGSQGPDMLFFSRASLLPGHLHKLGNLMHEEKVYEVISFFEDYAKNDIDLISYIYGYLCHYALDSVAHPLICAVAKYNHEKNGVHEGTSHVSSEADIDIWMLHQRGRKISSYDVFKYFKVDSKSRAKLAKMYHEMFKAVYDIDISEKRFAEAIRDTAFYTWVLKPAKGIYTFANALENTLKMPHSFSGMILYNKSDTRVLNIERLSYPLSYDETKTISASFPQLYGKAIFLAKKLIEGHDRSDFSLNFNGEPID